MTFQISKAALVIATGIMKPAWKRLAIILYRNRNARVHNARTNLNGMIPAVWLNRAVISLLISVKELCFLIRYALKKGLVAVILKWTLIVHCSKVSRPACWEVWDASS